MENNNNMKVEQKGVQPQEMLQLAQKSTFPESGKDTQNFVALAACMSALLSGEKLEDPRMETEQKPSTTSFGKESNSLTKEPLLSYSSDLNQLKIPDSKIPLSASSLMEHSTESAKTENFPSFKVEQGNPAPDHSFLETVSEFAARLEPVMPQLESILDEMDRSTTPGKSDEERFVGRMTQFLPELSQVSELLNPPTSEAMAAEPTSANSTESSSDATIPNPPQNNLPDGLTSGYQGNTPSIFAFAKVAQQNINLNGLQEMIAAVEGSSSNVQTQQFNNSMLTNGTNLEAQLQKDVKKSVKQEQRQKKWGWFIKVFRVVDLVVSAIIMPETLPVKITRDVMRIVDKATGAHPMKSARDAISNAIVKAIPNCPPKLAQGIAVLTMGMTAVVGGAALGAFGGKGVTWVKSLGSKVEEDVGLAKQAATGRMGKAWEALKSPYKNSPVFTAAVLGALPAVMQTMVQLALLAPKGAGRDAAVAVAIVAALAVVSTVSLPAITQLATENMAQNGSVTLIKALQWAKVAGLGFEASGNAGLAVNGFNQGKTQGAIQSVGAHIQFNNQINEFVTQENQSYQQSIAQTLRGAQGEIMTIVQAFAKQAAAMDFTLQV